MEQALKIIDKAKKTIFTLLTDDFIVYSVIQTLDLLHSIG